MSESLVFMMGKFEARFPVDRLYSENHLWLQRDDDVYRVGFTSYSVRLLQDVYFLDWTIDPNTLVKPKQQIGEIESSKALSTLYGPSGGEVLDFNADLLDDPSGINTDNYGTGWLYRFRSDGEFMSPEDYIQHLDDGWEKTQNMIKGQMN
ncbi:MAG: glycine cleavage system protein H [Planctomycetota bacterium]|nr:glycine cleavage system protein H [Planctomycetota bacterium]